MSILSLLLVAAVGGGASAAADSSASSSANASAPESKTGYAIVAPASPGRTPSQWRQAIADAMRKANSAKPGERSPAVEALVALFNELGQDQQLSPAERGRLGAEIRSRLSRFANQFRYELAHPAQRAAASANSAAGGAAADGLDNLVDLISKTIGPQDWVLAQRIAQPGQQGAQAGAAANRNGGAFGGGIEADVDANGQALVGVIQDTIAPDSWDIRGGPGSIVFYGPLRALIVRQTGEGHEAMGDLLNALHK